MLGSKTILVVDGNVYTAIDLCDAIADCGGLAEGPVSTLSETLAVIDRQSVAGAVVDCDLAEAGDVIAHLSDRAVPVVGHSAVADSGQRGPCAVLMRPVIPRDLLDLLHFEMAKTEGDAPIMLGSAPKKD